VTKRSLMSSSVRQGQLVPAKALQPSTAVLADDHGGSSLS
jgi:hypothetical protein